MSITITITDPTVAEANAVRAYLNALHGTTYTETAITDNLAAALAKRADEPETTAEDAGAPDFDSAGFPWNAEIHASSRATLADGTWKKKRGVSDELVAKIEAGFKAPDAPEVPEAPVPEPDLTADAPAAPAAPEPTVDAPSTPAPDAPAAPPVDTPNPFLAVMSRIGKSGLTKETKDELLTAAGALDDKGNPSILVLNKKPELIAGFVALLDDAGV